MTIDHQTHFLAKKLLSINNATRFSAGNTLDRATGNYNLRELHAFCVFFTRINLVIAR